MKLLPAVILGIAIILAALIWVLVPRLLSTGQIALDGPSIDSGARIEIEMLNQQVEDLRAQMTALSEEMARVRNEAANAAAAANRPTLAPSPGSNDFKPTGPNTIIDAYAQVVLIADRRNVNKGLKIAGPNYLSKTFGPPRANLSDRCESMTNERLAGKLVTETVGPIKVSMLKPAIDSLRTVMENIRLTDQDLYDRINTAGALCVRQIRGTRGRASTHAFGLAVDLNIDGVLDTLGDGKTQLGLTILADFFRAEGWVWGASWRREDSMHFEVSRQKLDEWVAQGKL